MCAHSITTEPPEIRGAVMDAYKLYTFALRSSKILKPEKTFSEQDQCHSINTDVYRLSSSICFNVFLYGFQQSVVDLENVLTHIIQLFAA